MLVLSRKLYERIMIGDDIVLQIVEIHDGKVKVGIQAPKTVVVHREEVLERIKQEGLRKRLDFEDEPTPPPNRRSRTL